MVRLWWWLPVVPSVVLRARKLIRRRGAGKQEEQGGQQQRGRQQKRGWQEEEVNEAGKDFACERVCTSRDLLLTLGGDHRIPSSKHCVTVCSVGSQVEACTRACEEAVCMADDVQKATDQLPSNWREVCLPRCAEECRKGR